MYRVEASWEKLHAIWQADAQLYPHKYARTHFRRDSCSMPPCQSNANVDVDSVRSKHSSCSMLLCSNKPRLKCRIKFEIKIP